MLLWSKRLRVSTQISPNTPTASVFQGLEYKLSNVSQVKAVYHQVSPSGHTQRTDAGVMKSLQ